MLKWTRPDGCSQEPERRVCGKCKQQGHINRDCPSKAKKLRFSLLDDPSGNSEAMDAESADTQDPISMPTIPTAWGSFDVEGSELDLAALAKSLTQIRH